MRPQSYLLILAFVTVAGRASGADRLAPYREFAAKLKTPPLGSNLVWETVFEAKPDGKPFWGAPTKSMEREPTRDVSVRVEKLKDESVLIFDAEKCEAGFLPVGPKVKDDVAIEIVCRSRADVLNDLSILFGGITNGPGFQFGGYDNTRNFLRVDDDEGEWKRIHELPGEPVIERDRWHTVRLELVSGWAHGFVDGKKLGEAELIEPVLLETERQPIFYIYNSLAEVRKLVIQKPKEKLAAKSARSPAEQAALDTKIAELIKLLDDEDHKIRTGASDVLKLYGHHAHKQLRATAVNGTVEQRFRARELLGLPEGDP